MAANYNKLWKILIDRNIRKEDLRVAAGITTTAMAKLGKNQPVHMEILLKICKVLDCQLEDVVEITEDVIDKAKKIKDATIKQTLVNGIRDIQILSCAPSGESLLDSYIEDGFYIYKGQKVPVTTCRKFKGLEADKVILVDVNKTTIVDENKLFYVGSSRARFELSILANLTDEDCAEVLQVFNSSVKKNNPQLTLSKVLGCKLI